MTHTSHASNHQAEVADLHDAIAARVAVALETGGPSWGVTAPLVEDLLDGDWTGAAPVVLARALGRAQRRQAAGVARALERGDEAAAGAIVARLRRTCERLTTVLGPQDGEFCA